MNEFERKLYIFKIQKYRKCDAIIMPQVISIKNFYTSINVLLFFLFSFFKRTSRLHKKNLRATRTLKNVNPEKPGL